MNKKITIIFLLIALASITIFLSYKTYNYSEDNKELKEEIESLKDQIKKENKNESSSNNEDNNSYEDQNVNGQVKENYERIIELSLSELNKKMDEKNNFSLIVTQTNCGHCTRFKPELNKFLEKNDLFIYELDFQKLSSEEKTKFKEHINVSGTPTIVFINNGEETDTSKRLIGGVSESKLEETFKEQGYIK